MDDMALSVWAALGMDVVRPCCLVFFCEYEDTGRSRPGSRWIDPV